MRSEGEEAQQRRSVSRLLRGADDTEAEAESGTDRARTEAAAKHREGAGAESAQEEEREESEEMSCEGVVNCQRKSQETLSKRILAKLCPPCEAWSSEELAVIMAAGLGTELLLFIVAVTGGAL